MTLKGEFNSGTTYSVGDAVKWTDGHIYHLQKPAKAGTTPADTLHWGRAEQVVEQCALFVLDGMEMTRALIPQNINDEAITLKGSGDNEYLITVDDSGETPELEVTLIEEEAAEADVPDGGVE